MWRKTIFLIEKKVMSDNRWKKENEMIYTAKEFIELRDSNKPEEYARAVQEEALLEVWHELVNKHPDMRFWVAQNKTVPTEILSILAEDEDAKVRTMVASKNKLTDETLRKLAIDEDFFVRQRLVYRKKVSLEVLEILSNDPVEEIKNLAIEKKKNRDYKR